MSEEAAIEAGMASPMSRQFSLKGMMKLMTFVCVLFALVIVPPVLFFVIFVLTIAVTGALAITIWKGRGWVQAFAVGAILPMVCSLVPIAMTVDDPTVIILGLMTQLTALISGTGAAAYHGCLVRGGGSLPVPDLPFVRDWFSNEPIEDSTTA